MPEAPAINRYQPSFLRFPIQNDRTGFKPVYLPLILVVPGRKYNGRYLANSNVYDVRYYVVDAPDSSIVAGKFVYPAPGQAVINNLLVPEMSRFTINVSQPQLLDVLIDPSTRTFRDPSGATRNGQSTWGIDDARDGDVFDYTTIRGGIASTIPWFTDADYYDVSLFTIDVEDLPRPRRYLFIWEAKYKKRQETGVLSDDTSVTRICINDEEGLAQFRMSINHPGEVHNEMFRKTPPFYFDNNNFRLADDQMLEMYRPFADILQDIFDEQIFINGINHIDKIPAQLIPYLAYLIGWDLPNYIGVTDKVRRSILRYAVRLQQYKGSRRAIVELFDIFGFTIDLINLWYSTDGTRLVSPDEKLPEALRSNEITTTTVCQLEPIVANYSTDGFGQFEIPLMYRATDNILLNAYIVKPGVTKTILDNVVNQSKSSTDYLVEKCVKDNNHILISPLFSLLPIDDAGLVEQSEVLIDYKSGLGIYQDSGTVINKIGCSYDNLNNVLRVNLDHYYNFDDGSVLYLFATYPRTKLIIPEEMQNLRSNRFDVKILLRGGDPPSQQQFEFLMNFVYRLKAFHSLLRSIIYEFSIMDAYNVTDFCVLAPVATEGECGQNSEPQEQSIFRQKLYNVLVNEHKAWRSLDGTHKSDPNTEHLLNLPVTKPEGDQCQFTQVGQDRVTYDPDTDFDYNPDSRTKVCDDSHVVSDSCLKGRVKDNLDPKALLKLCEVSRYVPCTLGQGVGTYYSFPVNDTTYKKNGFGHYDGQRTTGFLGHKYRDYNNPKNYNILYSNRPYLIKRQLEDNQLLALQRASLDIQKDNFWFPSHRFATMMNLKEDYTSTTWRAKPIDFKRNVLDAKLSDDKTHLIYDDVPVVYQGNGVLPDISTFGKHDDRDFVVTHKIYLNNNIGHPAIKLCSMVSETSETEIDFNDPKPFDHNFNSYNKDCNKDYIGGYPSVTGRFDVDTDDLNTNEVEKELLDLPQRGSEGLISSLFTFGSGVFVNKSDVEYQYYRPYRFDCDCSKFGCGSESTADYVVNVSGCPLDSHRKRDGSYDFDQDQLRVDQNVVMTEKIGGCSLTFNGDIPNHIGIIDQCGEIPAHGSIRYKDVWGIIYEAEWTFINDQLDISWVTKSPNVWGQAPRGYYKGRILFRRGIITNIRHVLLRDSSGDFNLIGKGESQVIDYYQDSLSCDDVPFVDNFCYHYDCSVGDKAEMLVACGTRFSKVGDESIVWPILISDGSGVVSFDAGGKQPFQWMNVWKNNVDRGSLITICNI